MLQILKKKCLRDGGGVNYGNRNEAIPCGAAWHFSIDDFLFFPFFLSSFRSPAVVRAGQTNLHSPTNGAVSEHYGHNLWKLFRNLKYREY